QGTPDLLDKLGSVGSGLLHEEGYDSGHSDRAEDLARDVVEGAGFGQRGSGDRLERQGLYRDEGEAEAQPAHDQRREQPQPVRGRRHLGQHPGADGQERRPVTTSARTPTRLYSRPPIATDTAAAKPWGISARPASRADKWGSR